MKHPIQFQHPTRQPRVERGRTAVTKVPQRFAQGLSVGRASMAASALVLGIVVACDSHLDSSTAASEEIASTAAALNTSPAIDNFVVYAQRSMQLGAAGQFFGGDIGVAKPAVATVGTQLTVGDFTVVEASHNLLAPSASLGFHSRVGDVQTTTLQNNGGALHALGAFPGPAMPLLPLALPSAVAGADVSIDDFEARSLAPGNYGTLRVDGVALLEGGAFSFANVEIGPGARLLSESGSVSIQVAGRFESGALSEVAPIEAFDFFDWGHHRFSDAADLSIWVAGADGSTGTPPAVRIGEHSSVTALIAATHGAVSIGDGTIATGAIAGFDVFVGRDVVMTFQSGFLVSPSTQAGSQKLSGYISPAMAAAPEIGPVPPSTVINLAIELPVPNLQALVAYASAVSDPTNSLYGQYLTPSTFAASQYAPTINSYDDAVGWAQSNELTVTQQFTNRLVVDVVGTAAQIEEALFVNLVLGARPDGSSFIEPDREPSLNLGTPVDIGGLTNYQLPRPANGSGPSGTYVSADIRKAYASCTTRTGANQTLTILSFEGFESTDISTFLTQTGLTTQAVYEPAIRLDGFNGEVLPGQNETPIDVEMALTMAPGLSQVIVVEGTI